MGLAETQSLYGPSEIERLTGIPMNTLRAWERRYGVPKPQRGPGGHRLYSEGELQTLQWIRKQLNAGVSISHAIANLRAQQPAAPNVHPQALVAEFVEACHALDERRAEKTLSDAFAYHTVERVCVQVIAPAMHEMGHAWAEGRASICAEHFTTAMVQATLYSVLRTLPIPPHRPLLFVACPSNEHHAIAPLMLSVLLRRAGWRAMFFGPNLPLDDVATILPELQPDVLLLSVSLPENLAPLYQQMTTLRQRVKLPPVLMGGRAFVGHEAVPATLGAHYLGNDILAGIAKLDTLLPRLLGAVRAV